MFWQVHFKKLGIHAWKVDFDFNPAFPLEFRFFICIFFNSEVSNCRHKLHDRKYTVSSFQKTSEWENPWCTRGFVWLLFDLSNFEFFFPPFISLLKTTREAEVVTELPRFWFERDELQCTIHNKQWHTKRQLASLVTYSCWNLDSSRTQKKKLNSSEAVQIQFQTVEFFSFTSFPNEYIRKFSIISKYCLSN